jgi:hypothetical protein
MIRRGLLAGLMLAGVLGGCGVLGSGSAEPDTLAVWVTGHAVPVTKPGDYQVNDGRTVTLTEDQKGVAFSRPKEGESFPMRVYFVPVSALDGTLDSDLRKGMFPSGTATLSPAGDSKEDRKVSEAELDKLYYELVVVPKSAQCGEDAHLCDAVHAIALIGALKGNSVMGQGSRKLFLAINDVVNTDKLLEEKVKDTQDVCGIDPQNDRVPHHIAYGCRGMLLLRYARDNGFGIDRKQNVLTPVTPDALKTISREALRQSLYKDGKFKGTLVLDGRQI